MSYSAIENLLEKNAASVTEEEVALVEKLAGWVAPAAAALLAAGGTYALTGQSAQEKQQEQEERNRLLLLTALGGTAAGYLGRPYIENSGLMGSDSMDISLGDLNYGSGRRWS